MGGQKAGEQNQGNQGHRATHQSAPHHATRHVAQHDNAVGHGRNQQFFQVSINFGAKKEATTLP